VQPNCHHQSGEVVATNTPESLLSQMNAGGGYELEVEGTLETTQWALQSVEGVTLVQSFDDDPSVTAAGRHRFQVSVDEQKGRDIAAAIVGAGLGLYAMRPTGAQPGGCILEIDHERTPCL
jgi:ABC-2 type transport system ATP-binding protein